MKKSVLLRGAVCGALLLSVGACSKIRSMVGGGDGGSSSLLSSGLSLSGFEGEIDLSITAKDKGKPDKTFTVPLLVKANKFRINEPAGIEGAEKIGNVYAIVDADAKKAYAVLDQPKQVIEIDLNTVGDQVKAMKPPSPTASTKPGATEPPKYPPKIEKTGKSDTVAGFSCEIWNISSTEPGDKSHAEVCVSHQGVSWFHLPMTGAPAEFAALGELADGSHFPMRAVGYGKDGVEEGRMEVSKVDKKTLDAQTFTPPASYKVVDIGQAVQGFMMGGMTGNPGEMGAPGMRGGFPHQPVHH
ncbi:MAG: DUF4412 domain-containing protein [Polyangiaceae bacterium]